MHALACYYSFMSIKVSIIVPFYNLGKFLDEAIDSVVKQSFSDWEVLIIDDGSTEVDSILALKKYEASKFDERINVIHTQNSGLPKARNLGISKAKGDYIICLDADDKIAKNYLRDAVKVFAESDENLAIVNTWIQEFDNSTKLQQLPDYDELAITASNVISVAAMFRKSVWQEVNGYPIHEPRGYEDWGFWLSIVAKGYKWTTLPKAYFYYRIRENSMLSGSRKNHNHLYAQIIGNNEDYFKKNIKEILIRNNFYLNDAHKYITDLEKSLKLNKEVVEKYSKTIDKLEFQIYEIHQKLFYKIYLEFKNNKNFPRKITKILKLLLPKTLTRILNHIYSRANEFRTGIYRLLTTKRIKIDEYDSNKPLVSVIMPCYNYGRFLAEAIESIVDQTWADWELFVINDGSTEEETNIVFRELETQYKTDSRIKFISQKNSGVSATRNNGIRLSQGKYICCLDADDKLAATYLEKCLLKLEADNLDICYTSAKLFDKENSIINVGPININDIFAGNSITTTALFKRDLALKVGGYAEDMKRGYEDWDFWLKLLKEGAKSGYIIEPIFLYRRHGNSLTNKTDLIHNELVEELKRRHHNYDSRLVARVHNRYYAVENPLSNILPRLPRFNKDKKRNIVFAMPYPILGGAEVLTYSILKHLVKENYGISFFLYDRASANSGDRLSDFYELSKDIWNIAELFSPNEQQKSLLEYLINTRGITSLFIAGNPTVHNHLKWLKKRFANIRIIDQQYNTIGHVAKNISNQKYIDITNSDNNSVIAYFRKLGRPDSKLNQIQTGVDVSKEFNPEVFKGKLDIPKHILKNKKFIVSYIGRWSEEKGPDIFVQIADSLRERKDILFVMAGDGPMRENIMEMVGLMGFSDTLYIPGIIDTKSLLKVSSICVIPSRMDGYPLIALESQSMGVPIVASKVGGLPEVIRDKKTGRIVEPEAVNEFKIAIESIIKNNEVYNQYSSNARVHAVKHFDLEKMSREYEQLIINNK